MRLITSVALPYAHLEILACINCWLICRAFLLHQTILKPNLLPVSFNSESRVILSSYTYLILLNVPTVLILVHLNPFYKEGNFLLSLFNQQAMLCISLLMENFQVYKCTIYILSSRVGHLILSSMHLSRFCLWYKGE